MGKLPRDTCLVRSELLIARQDSQLMTKSLRPLLMGLGLQAALRLKGG